MEIDISVFDKNNVIDTCSIWNILSSTKLYSTIISIIKVLSLTEYVVYESLYKPRKTNKESDKLLKMILAKEIDKKCFQIFKISIEDLQDIGILKNRKKFGKGEISSIAFAKKSRISFLTEDQNARKFSKNVVGVNTQTTPHLLGWLFFEGYLLDGDLHQIITEHKAMDGKLENYFKEVFLEAMRCKLLKTKS